MNNKYDCLNLHRVGYLIEYTYFLFQSDISVKCVLEFCDLSG